MTAPLKGRSNKLSNVLVKWGGGLNRQTESVPLESPNAYYRLVK
jgi:hypothetical protein